MSDEQTESWWDTKLDVDVCEHGRLVGKCEVCELKAEIARLRRVCRSSEMCIMLATSGHVTAVERVQMLNCIRKDLADAGKEPSDEV